jgi:hypothetical protein
VTYVRFHQTSLTSAKVGDAIAKRKAMRANHIAKWQGAKLISRGEKRARLGEGGPSKRTTAVFLRSDALVVGKRLGEGT